MNTEELIEYRINKLRESMMVLIKTYEFTSYLIRQDLLSLSTIISQLETEMDKRVIHIDRQIKKMWTEFSPSHLLDIQDKNVLNITTEQLENMLVAINSHKKEQETRTTILSRTVTI